MAALEDKVHDRDLTMNSNGLDERPEEEPKLEIISHNDGGYFVGVRDENGVWPFQSEVFHSREEADKKLSELNAPLPYEALCEECKTGIAEQEFLDSRVVSGLWACPCSENSLLFPRSQTVEESVMEIQEFVKQRVV
jgi:hypothetical protein